MSKKTEIVKHHLILCEGADEFHFLIAWLNSSVLKEKDLFWSEEIQVLDFGGNEQLKPYISGLMRAEGFDQVKSILIIRDAEKDVDKAISEISTAIKENDLPLPREIGKWEGAELKVAYLLLPSLDNSPCPGTLEDLCANILSENEKPEKVLPMVESLLCSLEELRLRTFPHKHKSKLHAYFSVTDKYVSAKVGEAAQWGAFDWKNDRLKYLEELLHQIK